MDDLSSGYLKNIEDLLTNPAFQFIQSDILGYTEWEKIIEPGDVILHLAATVGVNKVVVKALETLENNNRPTLFLLELAGKYHCKVFFSSTSEVYGELHSGPFSESDPLIVPSSLCGRSAYILGKIISEQYCVEYCRQKGVPVIIARFFNVVGNNQSSRFGMVVPTFIEQAFNSQPITIYGDGSQSRSFCDIEDLILAVRMLLNCPPAWGKTFNIGSAEAITINQLACYIREQIGSGSRLLHLPFPDNRSRGLDIRHRAACIEKIQAFTGWEPRVRWMESVDSIIANRLIESKTSLQT